MNYGVDIIDLTSNVKACLDSNNYMENKLFTPSSQSDSFKGMIVKNKLFLRFNISIK